jgi:hypothetical protein
MTDGGGKGSYGRPRLSVSRRYLYPRSRARMHWIGLLGILAVTAVFLFSLLGRSGEFASGGPLSSAHATIESDCNACHRTLSVQAGKAAIAAGAAGDRNCMACHGGTDRTLGAYSYPRHAVYTARDTAGTAEAAAAHDALPCASCHPEHRGRDASLIEVIDARCLSCHPSGSFDRDHPQLDFQAEAIPDDSTLAFTHVRHAKEVLKTFSLARPCAYCHEPAGDGRSFRPIDFEDHCGYCHLNGTQGTGSLPVADASDPASAGVETLEMIRARGEPGTRWAQAANPNEYDVLPGRVKKRVVSHRDPWVLENLRRIRGRLYPGLGVAGTLDTYGLASNENPKILYREAAATLTGYVDDLNARQELAVKQDLNRIRSFLNATRILLERDDAFPGAAAFTAPYAETAGDGAVTGERRKALFALADTLAHTCRLCHQIDHASIARVQKRQTALIRSRFDHAPHLLDGDCLDCHGGIPLDPVQVAEFNPQTFDWSTDRSAVQNLPGIETCRECHSSRKTTNACVSCHLFHPSGMAGRMAGRP